MQKKIDFLKHAEECEKLARGTLSADQRKLVMGMADSWRMLAKQREKMIGRSKEDEPTQLEWSASVVPSTDLSHETRGPGGDGCAEPRQKDRDGRS